jgi:glucose-6-phosphate isomerase
MEMLLKGFGGKKMEKRITFDALGAKGFINDHEMEYVKETTLRAKDNLTLKKGPGREFHGWVDLPINYNKVELRRIKKVAKKIRGESEVFVVIGIGGSYLGARAAIEFLGHTFANNLSKEKRRGPEIYYAGHNISGTYLNHLVEIIGDRDFSINMISKSGTTTEPAIAFRVLKKRCEERYGKKEAAKRIYVTTDKSKGALREVANSEGYETFVVPDDIGGRYSVLSAVGLLPIAVAGASIDLLLAGAKAARNHALVSKFEDNDALRYAAVRNLLLQKGKNVEILVNYEPNLHYLAEWWKQLYGESEGKDGKGIFPAAVDFTTDLHSMGQFIQEGNRILFETTLNVEESKEELLIEEEEVDLDGLNYLAGETVDHINKNAMKGTVLAHIDGRVPNLTINIPKADEFYLGQLFYMLQFACGVSGYMLGVNPFDQPGVESYKKNMFALLGKPGFETEREELLKRL